MWLQTWESERGQGSRLLLFLKPFSSDRAFLQTLSLSLKNLEMNWKPVWDCWR